MIVEERVIKLRGYLGRVDVNIREGKTGLRCSCTSVEVGHWKKGRFWLPQSPG